MNVLLVLVATSKSVCILREMVDGKVCRTFSLAVITCHLLAVVETEVPTMCFMSYSCSINGGLSG